MLPNQLSSLSYLLNFIDLQHWFYCDTVSDVYLSSNPVQHQHIKHVDIDLHFFEYKILFHNSLTSAQMPPISNVGYEPLFQLPKS